MYEECEVEVPTFCGTPPRVIAALCRRWMYNPLSALCYERWALWRKIGAL